MGLSDPCGNGVRSREDASLVELGNRRARAIGAERPRVIRAHEAALRVDGAKGKIDTTMRALASDGCKGAIGSAPKGERAPEQSDRHHCARLEVSRASDDVPVGGHRLQPRRPVPLGVGVPTDDEPTAIATAH